MKFVLLCSFVVLFNVHVLLGLQVQINGQTGQVFKDLTQGDTDTVSCTYSGGQGQITWYYKSSSASGSESPIVNGDKFELNVVSTTRTDLKINAVTPDMNGIYVCRAKPTGDDTGAVGVGEYHVTVLVPPSTPVCNVGDGTLVLNHRAQFTCMSQGIPDPKYKWFKGGVELPEVATNQNANVSYDTTTGILIFQKVARSDAGSYHCEASSRAGSSTCDVREIVIKEQDVGAIVGIVFGCIFAVLLIGVLIWWTWKKGYCSGFKKDDDDDMDDDANDVMLDGTGPEVNKPASLVNGSNDKQEASMMI